MKTDAGGSCGPGSPAPRPPRWRRARGRIRPEVEGDHRERGGGDRADAGGQAVHTVGEVDDVHHPDEPDERERAAELAELEAAEERDRRGLHADSGHDEQERRDALAREFGDRRQVADVVDRADRRHERGPAEDGPGLLPGRQEQRAGQQHPGEDRQPAEQRRGLRGQPPLGHPVHAPVLVAARAMSGVITAATAKATRHA
jgi:hypothetical protein